MKVSTLTLTAVLVCSEMGRINAFAPPTPSSSVLHGIARSRSTGGAAASTAPGAPLFMSSPASSSESNGSSQRQQRKKKKSVQDRTQQETISLIQDVIKAVFDAGPRAGPARTLQAYQAISRTIQDFVPSPFAASAAEAFSAPVALRKLFERLGATYVKLGQFIASSPTLFPAAYVTEFQKCLDQTEAIDWNIIKGVIETEIGPIARTFSYIDAKPLASASIAQVHRATLRSTGEDVVIKVQKPRIDESLKADLSFIYVTSRILEFVQPDWERTSLSAIAGDVRESMLQELDFQAEATNVEEFREFLVNRGLTKVATAPRIYRDLTTKKVLTMEYLNGVSLLDKEAIVATTKTLNPEQTIISALNVWTESVQTMPWFHADVHAGNLLVLRDGRVGFIDFGIVGRVSEKTFSAVNELSTALAMGDYNGMAQALCNMGATDETVDIAKFGRDIENVMTNLMTTNVNVAAMSDGTAISGTMSVDEEELTTVLLDIVKVTEDNGLKLPREFGLLVKQSLYFDRYLKILAPGLDVMADDRVGGLGSTLSPVTNGGSPVNGGPPINGSGGSAEEVIIDV